MNQLLDYTSYKLCIGLVDRDTAHLQPPPYMCMSISSTGRPPVKTASLMYMYNVRVCGHGRVGVYASLALRYT